MSSARTAESIDLPFAVWIMDSVEPKEAQIQLHSPGGASVPTQEGTLAPPGEYN